ncbi:MAG: thiamine phosphate synthase [Deltaproteobacteria bacterium]|nr:thiamine phosphate synthase [Deltaproteobacteria bacterium]
MIKVDFDLYLVTDRQQTNGRELLWVLEQALDGGVQAIQLREKDLDGKELYYLAEAARQLTIRYRARLFINDRIDVALAVDADGVHLGGGSVPIETARQLLGPEQLIGASVHALTEAQQAERAGADFIVFGPVYFTPSKAAYGSPQGLEPLRQVVEKIARPVYAIGGIKQEQIKEVLAVKARGIALISAIISAADPREAAHNILTALREG